MNRAIIGLLLALCISTPLQGRSLEKELMRRNFIRQSRCLETVGLTMDEVEAYAVFGKIEEAESRPEMKCLSGCLMERSGYMHNCIVQDEIFAHNQEFEDFYNLLVTCKGRVNAGDRCECGHQLAKCVVEERPEDF